MPPQPLPPPQEPSSLPPEQARINLAELKSQIAKRLGPERSQLYFSYLNRFLSQKLSKPELNKLCLVTLGRDNLPLHNQLIRSILKNAFLARVPPPVSAPTKAVANSELCQSLVPANLPPVWSNGDILPSSPRKCRSAGVRSRIIDRPSPLGPNGRVDVGAHQVIAHHSEDAVFRENGDLAPYDLKRTVQNQQGRHAEQPPKRQRTEEKQLLLYDQGYVPSTGRVEVAALEHREDSERRDTLNSARGPLHAPLGIPFCPASIGGAQRSLPQPTSSSIAGSYDLGELCHTEALRKRMEAIAEAHGLGGVSMDCANLLNNGVDAYLKRLIKSCVELVRERVDHRIINHPAHKQQCHGKPINGVLLGNHMHAQSTGGPHEGATDHRNHYMISPNDFKVAMELNPRQLGEDWALLLEKICLSSFEE